MLLLLLSQTPGISSIFSGLSVSGEKATHRPKPVRKKEKKKQQPSPRAGNRGAGAGNRGASVRTEKKEEEKKGFEDILGLVGHSPLK